jgi:hypothetical protein
MKSRIILLAGSLIMAISSGKLAAQKFELIPFAGYETGANINAISGGVFHFDGGLSYGGAFNVGLKNDFRLELSYSRMVTDLTYTIDNSTDDICELALNKISLGFIWEYNPEDKFVPYARFALGSVIYDPTDTETESEKIMHFSISGGAKYNLSDHIGFRFQANLLLPLFFEGLYFTEDSGGEEPEVGTKIAGVQGEFTAGVVFRF